MSITWQNHSQHTREKIVESFDKLQEKEFFKGLGCGIFINNVVILIIWMVVHNIKWR